MSETTNNLVAEITKAIASIKGCRFASLKYLTKKSNELARYTVLLGFSYHDAVEKSRLELELLIKENAETWSELQKQAATEVMDSLLKTLAAHAVGDQNEDYTKKGQYIPIRAGLNLNTKDNTIQLFGLVESKVTIEQGQFMVVNSSPLTIAKNKIRRMLPVGKFREFALDISQIDTVKVNGETFVMGGD